MGSVYRKIAPKPVPHAARIIRRKGKRLAEWKGRDGRKRTAEVKTRPNGSEYLLVP